MCENIG